MTQQQAKPREFYDGAYYGNGGKKANYDNYNGRAVPHWSLPLARWLIDTLPGPFLDIGCAFGHLIRDINRLALPRVREFGGQVVAVGIEWSDYAAAERVSRHVVHADARTMREHFRAWAFGTVVSLDFLEHFPPEETRHLLGEMATLIKPGGYMVHLIGALNPGADLAMHESDPSHVNHEALPWYIGAIEQAAGCTVVPALTEAINKLPAWVDSDWNGRMIVARKNVTPEAVIRG